MNHQLDQRRGPSRDASRDAADDPTLDLDLLLPAPGQLSHSSFLGRTEPVLNLGASRGQGAAFAAFTALAAPTARIAARSQPGRSPSSSPALLEQVHAIWSDPSRGQRQPDSGRQALVMQEGSSGDSHAARASTAERDATPVLEFDDYRVLGLRAVLHRLGAGHPLRHDLIAASAASDRSIAGRATQWSEPLSASPTEAGLALWRSSERHAATLYRHAVSSGEIEGDNPAVASALQQCGSGQPLPESIRHEMERELGVSLTGVCIHTDGVAARAAIALHADAFALGQDIFFAAGAFAPDSRAGRKLLAHELTHVAQMLRGRTASSGRGVQVSHPDEPLEREADAVAARIDAEHDEPGRATSAQTAHAAGPSQTTKTAAPPRARIFRQVAGGRPQAARTLPASTNALHGIELYYLVGSVPRTEGVDFQYLIYTDQYLIAPQMIDRNTASPTVTYYIAARKNTGQNEFVIGPDSLPEFLANQLRYAGIGGMTYMFGTPPPHVRASSLMVRSVILGRYGEATSRLGDAWREALQDPGWWVQAITATSGALQRVPGPVPRPGLTVIQGGGGPAVAGAATPMTVGNTALVAAPEVVTAAPPQLRLLVTPNPAPLPTTIASPPIPAYLAAAAASIGSVASHINAPVPVPVPQPAPESDPESQGAPEVILHLPSAKVPRIALYQSLALERRLVHEASYTRGRPAQIPRWEAALSPGGAEGMSTETFEQGVQMGLQRRRILRPDWSRQAASIAMEVDHVVELQVLRSSDRGWADTISNYELLDYLSNGTSGGVLAANISAERQRLAAQTGDSGWLTRDLIFTQVIPMPGDLGQRWTREEIQQGVHIIVLRQLLGE